MSFVSITNSGWDKYFSELSLETNGIMVNTMVSNERKELLFQKVAKKCKSLNNLIIEGNVKEIYEIRALYWFSFASRLQSLTFLDGSFNLRQENLFKASSSISLKLKKVGFYYSRTYDVNTSLKIISYLLPSSIHLSMDPRVINDYYYRPQIGDVKVDLADDRELYKLARSRNLTEYLCRVNVPFNLNADKRRINTSTLHSKYASAEQRNKLLNTLFVSSKS